MAGDIKREVMRHDPSLGRNFAALGPAVFKGYQQQVLRLLNAGARRLVVDGLDPQYWKGQVISRVLGCFCAHGNAHSGPRDAGGGRRLCAFELQRLQQQRRRACPTRAGPRPRERDVRREPSSQALPGQRPGLVHCESPAAAAARNNRRS